MTKYVLRRPDKGLCVSCDFKPETDPEDAFRQACDVHDVPPEEPGVSFFRVGRLRSTTVHGLRGMAYTDFWREPGKWIVDP
jgi:hypothetical protein